MLYVKSEFLKAIALSACTAFNIVMIVNKSKGVFASVYHKSVSDGVIIDINLHINILFFLIKKWPRRRCNGALINSIFHSRTMDNFFLS